MEEADNGVYVEIEMITLARQSGEVLDKSRYLNGFQGFPKELVQGYIAALEYITHTAASSYSALAVSLISCPGSPPALTDQVAGSHAPGRGRRRSRPCPLPDPVP